MATHLPRLNEKTHNITYNYRSLNASMVMKKNTPMHKSQSISTTRNIDRYYATSDVKEILGN